ncbi:MAG: NAD+ synthase [Planctomycetota bacterium]|jgi:NAD+ synthetase
MRITIAQLSPILGDVEGNTGRITAAIDRAVAEHADVMLTCELSVLGYPPRDLLLRSGVIEACERAADRIVAYTGGTGGLTVLFGHPRREPGGLRGVRNSVTVCRGGAVVAVADKQLLPGYDVFDEDRYFDPGTETCIVDIGGHPCGVVICDDLWRAADACAASTYAADPLAAVAASGAKTVLALNASPFVAGKWSKHHDQLRATARDTGLTIVAVNQVGGFDDLVFDGRSLVVDGHASVRAVLPGWTEAIETIDLADGAAVACEAPQWGAEVYRTLVSGVKDYVTRTGHGRVLLGLSGGIDSALTATIAAAAVGPENVTAVMLPSRYSSRGSRDDALALSTALGLHATPTISIEGVHEAARAALSVELAGGPVGLTDENIQARARGLLLMGLANATGGLLLATSNKSELAVGYSTLYGDMCGALSVIGDLFKTEVWELSRWINANADACGFSGPPIPASSIDKVPSAELRPDQSDQDSLPPYEDLDAILRERIDREASIDEVNERTGLDETLVREVCLMVDRAEFKRYQGAIVLKLGPRTFGRGRAWPLVGRSPS